MKAACDYDVALLKDLRAGKNDTPATSLAICACPLFDVACCGLRALDTPADRERQKQVKERRQKRIANVKGHNGGHRPRKPKQEPLRAGE